MSSSRRFQLFAVFAVALAFMGTARPAQAQHGNCWQCNYDVNTHVYSCSPSGGPGYNSCSTNGGACILGSQCGYERPIPLADGSVRLNSAMHVRQPVLSRSRRTGPPELFNLASTARHVERMCNGAIVQRNYASAVTRELRRASSSLRV